MLLQYGLVLARDDAGEQFHLFIVMGYFSRAQLNGHLRRFVLSMVACQVVLLVYGAN